MGTNPPPGRTYLQKPKCSQEDTNSDKEGSQWQVQLHYKMKHEVQVDRAGEEREVLGDQDFIYRLLEPIENSRKVLEGKDREMAQRKECLLSFWDLKVYFQYYRIPPQDPDGVCSPPLRIRRQGWSNSTAEESVCFVCNQLQLRIPYNPTSLLGVM